MREIRSYGSVRGVRSNPHPYRDIPTPAAKQRPGVSLRRTRSPERGDTRPREVTCASSPRPADQ